MGNETICCDGNHSISCFYIVIVFFGSSRVKKLVMIFFSLNLKLHGVINLENYSSRFLFFRKLNILIDYLFRRNLHNLPLRRIKEMLNRFENNVTVQSILDQLSSTTKSTNSISSEQQNHDKDQEILDPILTPKKFYDIIDDSLILDDVRLCINDMILFLTSNFFQTTRSSQSSTPISVSFHDLSLISSSTTSSLPSTPSTPHSRFHRPLNRFPSSTNQDHSFNTDLILRLPTSTFSRCIETNNLTPSLSAQSNIIGKKRRKNKNKQQSNELLLNVNNNNNNMNEEQATLTQQTYNVFLPEDCSDFVVIDEENANDWTETVNRNFGLRMNSIT